MAIRLKDIARELGVSVITVSKALRGKADISDATRERILKRVSELDYRPNMTARTLITGRSFIIGLIVPDLLNPFFNEFATSLSRSLRQRSYALILASSENTAEIEQSEIRAMFTRGVDALLLVSCQSTLRGFLSIHDVSTPLVLIDRPFPQLRAHFVGTDDYAGGRLATEHLIHLKRKRLAYIGSPDLSPAADRYRGFRHALRDHDIELREDFVLLNSSEEPADQAGYEMMMTLLKRRSRPNGVFCHNDVVAIGAMKAAQDAGLTIPGDIAFVGFDNVNYSKYLPIPLTSVDQSTSALGEGAAELALAAVDKKIDQPLNILLKPTLVVRQSTVGSHPANPSSAPECLAVRRGKPPHSRTLLRK